MKKIFLIVLIGLLIFIESISQEVYEKRKIVSISPLLYYQIRLKYESSINSINSVGLLWKINWSDFMLSDSDPGDIFKGTRIEPFIRWYGQNSVLKRGYFQVFGILGVYKGNVEYGYNEHTCDGWFGDYTCYGDEFTEKKAVFTAGAGILVGCQWLIGSEKNISIDIGAGCKYNPLLIEKKRHISGRKYVITNGTKNNWFMEGGNFFHGVISVGFLL